MTSMPPIRGEMTFPVEGTPYCVTVNIAPQRVGDEFAPRVSSITIKADPPASVSPRDVRRMRLSTYIEAAVALIAYSPNARDRAKTAREILAQTRVPRGRPERGRSTDFYRDLARAYQELAAANVRPVPEIARRKRVDENTVHQWIHRARKLGFLPPSSRGKGKR